MFSAGTCILKLMFLFTKQIPINVIVYLSEVDRSKYK